MFLLLSPAHLVARPAGDSTSGMPLVLAPCIASGVENQTFSFNTTGSISTVSEFCFDIDGYKQAIGSNVDAWPCGHNSRSNEYWAIKLNTLVSLQPDTPFCFGISSTPVPPSRRRRRRQRTWKGAGGAGILADCSSSAAQFTIGFDESKTGTLLHQQSGLCVTTGGKQPPLPPGPHPAPEPTPTPSPLCPPRPPAPTPPPSPPPPAGSLPCDIYDAAGTPCVAAHSMVRSLYRAYNGPLYMVTRKSDSTNQTIGLLTAGGVSNATAQESFCAGTTCTVPVIFDQSGRQNHLSANHKGRHFKVDRGVDASRRPISLSGHKAYGAWFDEGMGYSKRANTSGIAKGADPESMYAVFGGGHYDDVCCFDYGNAEDKIGAFGAGSMEAIYFGSDTSYWKSKKQIPPSWKGPYLMADIENGMYGGNDTFNPRNSPVNHDFNTLMLKGRTCEMSLKAGNAQVGNLTVKYHGGRPTHEKYEPMQKQGGIILGTGGDSSDRSLGIFYEGAMTVGYASAGTDDAIQANIVTAGYRNWTQDPQ